jgi:oxygen-independent coproporphyrinogen-3 oxidase
LFNIELISKSLIKKKPKPQTMPALYIHIPFCKKICIYCDFIRKCVPDGDPVLDRYVDALGKEMEFRRGFSGGRDMNTIFFGGGTPSVYPPSVIQSVIDKARGIWNIAEDAEITVEINPDDASEEWLEALSRTDVNRLSFGVQSFIDRDLQLLGRRHDAEQAVAAIRMARAKGFKNISIDLMFGIPGMSRRDWDRNLIKAIQLGVDHISTYHLTIEPGTELSRLEKDGGIAPIPETESEAQYLLAHRVLTGVGFDHYEVSNYARTPDKRSRHNCGYWFGEHYLGLGTGAHSYDGDRREFVVPSIAEYLKNAGTDKIYSRETLSPTDKYNEFMMLSLRTIHGVRRDILMQKFGVDKLLCFEYAAGKLQSQGLLVHDHYEYRIPPEKFMVSDAIIRELFISDEEES